MTLSDVIKVRMPKLWLLKVWMYNYKYKILYIALEIVSIHSMFIILFLLFVNQIDFLVPCPSDRLLPTTLIIVQGNKNYMNKVDFVSRTAQHIYYFHWILDGISRMSHTGMSHWKLETYSRSLDFIWRVILLFFSLSKHKDSSKETFTIQFSWKQFIPILNNDLFLFDEKVDRCN